MNGAAKSIEESIQALSRAVLNEARTEAEQILADARAKADSIRQHAQERSTAECEEILRRAHEEADRVRSQALAAAQLKARTLHLEHREKLLEDVFETARRRLHSVQQWSDYEQIVRQLVREAVPQLEVSVVHVRADEQAQGLLSEAVLAELSDELGVELRRGALLEHGTGVVVETVDGRRQYDNTLEARLSRLQEALRAPVYHLLMGESL